MTKVIGSLVTNPSESLQNIVTTAVNTVVSSKRLAAEEVAITVFDLSEVSHIRSASYRGEVPIYPASVVKLFYLEAAHRWMKEGKIQDTPELRRALRDMIVESSNDATHYVLDTVTGTTGGPELTPAEMAEWELKRNAINRYFAAQSYSGINVNQKTWCEGPYGRERVFMSENRDNRNVLTTDATARLLCGIVLGQCVSAKHSAEMMQLLERDPSKAPSNPDDQGRAFIGSALPEGSKLWSKAGWTSATRHDAAYIELPNGKKLIQVIFTINHSQERDLISTLAREIISAPRLFPQGSSPGPRSTGKSPGPGMES